MTVSDNLACAALISAADRLMVEGTVPRDEAHTDARALVAIMTYLNKYAFAHELSEQQAFAAVDAMRAEILASMTPDEVVAEARRCLATPSE